MTKVCVSCNGSFAVDEQSTHYVCPWCGHLNASASNSAARVLTLPRRAGTARQQHIKEKQ